MTKENVDELNKDILKIIREENPQRIVIYGGHSWSNSDHLLSARIPNDEYIVGYFHSYDPGILLVKEMEFGGLIMILKG